MQIASHAFLLLFLPVTLLLYYKLFRSPRAKLFFLLFASYFFYALAGWQFLPLLIGLSIATYFSARRAWTGAGIALNLLALGLFKYWNFGVENFQALLQAVGLQWSAKLLELGLPLGLSFFVFKHVGYLLDVRAGRYPAAQDPWSFALFSAYFPQISAGPISNFNDTASQLSSLPPSLDRGRAYAGLIFLSMGLAKKSLIADTLGGLLPTDLNALQFFNGFLPAWYLVLAYAMHLYFDFSGYTDMVLGASLLFGVILPPNFNSPYLATDPADFWGRWHISLSTWFRHYLFLPLSRTLLKRWGLARSQQSQYAANLATMSLIGLWHGAGWGFILWGAYHGLLLNLHAWWKRLKRPLPVLLGRPLLLFALLLGAGLFMSPNLASLEYLFLQLLGLGGFGSFASVRGLILGPATPALLIALPLAVSGVSEAAALTGETSPQHSWRAFLWGVLAAVSLLYLERNVQFLYVQF